MEERGVTPVVGEIILIGIAVAVASIVTVGVAHWAIVPPLPPSVIFDVKAESFDNVVRLTITCSFLVTPEGGVPLSTRDLVVQAEDKNGLGEVSIQWPDQLSFGDEGIGTYLYGADPADKTIMVRIISPSFEKILFTTVKMLTLGMEDWPMFNHDIGHTGSSTSLSPTENKLMSEDSTGADIRTSPVVSENRVYIVSGNILYCLDANNLKIIWTSDNSNPSRLEYSENYNASPAVVGGRVYTTFYSPSAGTVGTYCLGASDGRVIWSSALATAWAPIVTGGRLYGGSDGAAFCLDTDDGKLLWYSPGSFDKRETIRGDNCKAYEYASEELLSPPDVKTYATPAGPEAYISLENSDDKRWTTSLAGRYTRKNDQQYFMFKPNENTSGAVVGTFRWEGYAEGILGRPCITQLWLWNSVTSSWEGVGNGGGTSGDQTLSFTVLDFSRYVDINTGEFWLATTDSRMDTWWDNRWPFRRLVLCIVQGENYFPENYVISLVVPYDNDMKSDFSDLRFIDSGGSPLSYWIENYNLGYNATVYVAIPHPIYSLPIWMYYGNESATRADNMDAVLSIMHHDNYWVTEVRETDAYYGASWVPGWENYVKDNEDNNPAWLVLYGSMADLCGSMEVGFDDESENRMFIGAKITVWELDSLHGVSWGSGRTLEAIGGVENTTIGGWGTAGWSSGYYPDPSYYWANHTSKIVSTSTSFRYLRLNYFMHWHNTGDVFDYYLGSIEVEGYHQPYISYDINIGEEQPLGGLYTDYVELGIYRLPLPWPSFFSPAAGEGKIYVCSLGGLSCLDAYSWNNLWENLSVGVTSAPVISGGRIYFGAENNQVYSLDATTGKLPENFHVSGPSTPAVTGGRVYIGSNNGIYCLDADNLDHILWENHSVGAVSAPAVASDRVYFGSSDKYFYCFNAVNGEFIWKYWTGSSSFTAPAIANGRVYVGSGENIYCFGPASPF